MAKEKTVYVCSNCGESWPKWAGQCRACGEWGTLEEKTMAPTPKGRSTARGGGIVGENGKISYGTPNQAARPIGSYSTSKTERIPTGVAEFDRVLAGGIVPGAVILLAGEPGIGKSTLLLEVASKIAGGSTRATPNHAPNLRSGLRLVSKDTEDNVVSLERSSVTRAEELEMPPGIPDEVSNLASGSSEAGLRKLAAVKDPDSTGEAVASQSVLPPDSTNSSETEPRKVLYLTGEETAEQVLSRAERIGSVADNLFLAAETSVDQALAQIEATNPALAIVDSIQTLTDPLLETSIGGPAQVREVTARLTAAAKSRHMALILVGHVTKDGAVAGPRTLEHLVDVVCQFEGERTGELRLLRAVKNRYGPTDAVGFFQMVEYGIEGIADPSGLFLSQTAEPVPGACITMSLEGRRALPIEIEALTTPLAGGSPHRTVSGLDYSRVSMMLAVLQARQKLPLGSLDAYVSTVGGARSTEPATDLAVALATASAVTGQVIDNRTVAFGEVSLTGEIRSCTALSRRVAEASRLGFKRAIIPAAGAAKLKAPSGFKLIRAKNLREALGAALQPQ
ncbi:AAA family ATPase [Mobiluncus porci]|uniref:AAA family ATPase n=1 Tax=Mobiluncus porci TaxID=2652278 RepID=UPI001E64BEB1|nr:AAA family ATPase [Mobiluncus porci]